MRILYVTTRFPVFSETFIQREVRALLRAGVELEIVSLHGGEERFEGHPVFCFGKWSLLRLFYLLPWAIWRKGRELQPILREMAHRRPASPLNLFENLLGIGAAFVLEKRICRLSPEIIHCVWAGGPAAFGRVAGALTDRPFSSGAHAYDLFEHGGDWLLEDKLRRAALVHVSTEVAEKRVRTICDSGKVRLIRRGLDALPERRLPRERWESARIVCIARLVEKKGFPRQIEIYRQLKEAGVPFSAKIIGDGPLERKIREGIGRFGLQREVQMTGRLSEGDTQEQLRWADVLLHTGVVARSGDRDGLPNVVPEAMANGVIVLGSPVSGVVEAIEDGVTGFLCEPWRPEVWVDRLRELAESRELRCRMASAAREWVEREFVADRNTGYLIECLRVASG